MSDHEALLVTAFPSELPRGTGLRSLLCGSRASWADGPPPLPGSGTLIVSGSCAALGPDLPLGTLVLPERLRSREGDWLSPSAGLRAALVHAAEAAGRSVEGGGLAEVEAVVDEVPQRCELAQASGCRFADMESAALAAVAEEAGRPWAVLRFVSDSPEQSLAWLSELYGGFPAHEPGLWRTLTALARRPEHVGRLLALGRTVMQGRRAVGDVLRFLAL